MCFCFWGRGGEWETTRKQNPEEFSQSSSKFSLKLTVRKQKTWAEMVILGAAPLQNKQTSQNFTSVKLMLVFLMKCGIFWCAWHCCQSVIKHSSWDFGLVASSSPFEKRGFGNPLFKVVEEGQEWVFPIVA